MPVIRQPSATGSIGLSPPRAPRAPRLAPGVGEQFGRALARNSERLLRIEEQRLAEQERARAEAERVERARKIATAKVQATEILSSVEGEVLANEDISLPEKAAAYEAEARRRLGEALGRERDDAVRTTLALELRKDIATTSSRLRRDIYKQLSAQARDSAESLITASITRAATAGSEAERAAAISDARAAIDEMVTLGFIDKREAKLHKEAVAQSIAYQTVLDRVAQGKFGEAQGLLEQTKGLSPEQEQRLTNIIIDGRLKQLRLEDSLTARVEKAKREAQTERTRQFAVDVLEGRIDDPSALVAALDRGDIDLSGYETLSKILEAEGAPEDDPLLLFAVTRAALRGDARSVIPILGRSLQDGTLTKGSALRILTTLDEAQRRGGVLSRDDVKRGFEHIEAIVGEARGPAANITGDQAEATVRALEDYRERVLAAAQQPNFDPLAIAEQVAASWRTSPRTVLTLPRPRYMVGPNRAQIDIQATYAATARALQAGEIDDVEAERQMELIQQYEELLNVQALATGK